MMKVHNLTSEKSGRPVANQFVIVGDDGIMFQSYNSPIIEICYAECKVKVYPHYNYSVTTARHRNAFVRKYWTEAMASTEALEKAIEDGHYNNIKVEQIIDY